MNKEEAYEQLCTKLATRERTKIMYKLFIPEAETEEVEIYRTIMTESGKIKGRWNLFR